MKLSYLTGPVLVVDDNPSLVTFLMDYFEGLGCKVYCAKNGQEALSLIKKVSPSFIILDLMMPFLDGYETCKEIRRNSQVPIIMLTAKVEEEDKLRGLYSGADDYLTKPFSPRELVARMQTILRRCLSETDFPNKLQCGYLLYDEDKHMFFWKKSLIHLTLQEAQIVIHLLECKGKVCTREQLLNCLYPNGDYDVVDRIVDVHIGNIRQKVRTVDPEFNLIKTIRGIGYRLEVPNENQAFI
ncbi:response regulator transcription factor [Neobacillus niacini]|uniref:response regulator transcription factor n=1 Tax=Neobacillus niacini TaxID=86668 RepID=UPI0028659228|nr:response regulator transcription factor [Neobacillus niacini]MDR6998641.1 DNA-binding response OmpR family regulator [Neobacillus niacini]